MTSRYTRSRGQGEDKEMGRTMGGWTRHGAMAGEDSPARFVRSPLAAVVARSPLLRRWLAAGSVLAGIVIACSSPASAIAQPHHIFGGSFHGEGKCEFSEPGAIAVDEQNGDLFVYDRATNAVDWFGPESEFKRPCILH